MYSCSIVCNRQPFSLKLALAELELLHKRVWAQFNALDTRIAQLTKRYRPSIHYMSTDSLCSALFSHDIAHMSLAKLHMSTKLLPTHNSWWCLWILLMNLLFQLWHSWMILEEEPVKSGSSTCVSSPYFHGRDEVNSAPITATVLFRGLRWFVNHSWRY